MRQETFKRTWQEKIETAEKIFWGVEEGAVEKEDTGAPLMCLTTATLDEQSSSSDGGGGGGSGSGSGSGSGNSVKKSCESGGKVGICPGSSTVPSSEESHPLLSSVPEEYCRAMRPLQYEEVKKLSAYKYSGSLV